MVVRQSEVSIPLSERNSDLPDMRLDYIDDSTLQYRACMVSTIVRRNITSDTVPEKNRVSATLVLSKSEKDQLKIRQYVNCLHVVLQNRSE